MNKWWIEYITVQGLRNTLNETNISMDIRQISISLIGKALSVGYLTEYISFKNIFWAVINQNFSFDQSKE